MLENEFARFSGHPVQFDAAVDISVGGVFLNPLQNRERGVQRTVDRVIARALTVEAAIRHLLGDDEVHDGMQIGLIGLEVAGVVQEHAVDAHIALRDLPGRVDAAVFAFVFAQDDSDGLCNLRRGGGDVQVFQVEQGVVRGNPLDLIEAAPPVSVWLAGFQVAFPPSFGRDALLGFGLLFTQ